MRKQTTPFKEKNQSPQELTHQRKERWQMTTGKDAQYHVPSERHRQNNDETPLCTYSDDPSPEDEHVKCWQWCRALGAISTTDGSSSWGATLGPVWQVLSKSRRFLPYDLVLKLLEMNLKKLKLYVYVKSYTHSNLFKLSNGSRARLEGTYKFHNVGNRIVRDHPDPHNKTLSQW